VLTHLADDPRPFTEIPAVQFVSLVIGATIIIAAIRYFIKGK
jgi:hypothetical protein